MKIKKILPKTLALTILTSTLINPSFASGVNTNSGFYRSSRTRQAYVNLTNEQRLELDAMNKNNNGWLTIKEVKDYGRHSLPVVKGQSYLYPFMDDRNNNGMVGENETEGSENSTSREDIDQENNQEALEEIFDEEIENSEKVEEENLEENLDSPQTPIPNEEIEEKPVENQIPSTYLDRLEESLENAKTSIGGAELLIQIMPKFSTINRELIQNLIEKQYQIIARAEKILIANGREIVND